MNTNIVENLLKRENDRQQKIIQKKDEKQNCEAKNEKHDFIEKIFNEKINGISKLIDDSSDIAKDNLPTHFDVIIKDLNQLKKFISDSVIFLRNYDIRIFNSKIHELETKIKENEEILLPKKKFGFKNKAKKITDDKKSDLNKKNNPIINILEKNDPYLLKNDKLTTNFLDCSNGKILETDKIDGSCSGPHLTQFDTEFYGFRDISNKILKLDSSLLTNKDISLHNLKNCIIKLHGNPNTLHISSLTHCTILSGPVTTSIFADNCHNCHFTVSCQQLRFHKSSNCHLYLHVTSKAIIEDCTKIFTAPYNYFYDNLLNDFKNVNFDLNINNWDKIDDFNWLVLNKKSPNWEILSDNSRVDDWDEFFLKNYENVVDF